MDQHCTSHDIPLWKSNRVSQIYTPSVATQHHPSFKDFESESVIVAYSAPSRGRAPNYTQLLFRAPTLEFNPSHKSL